MIRLAGSKVVTSEVKTDSLGSLWLDLQHQLFTVVLEV